MIGRRCFSTVSSRVGFIGLGQMGIGMASQLAKQGHSVMGFDVNQPSLDKAAGMGITPASSVEEVGRNCQTIVTMLRTADQVEGVYSELFSVCGDNTVFIDSSTVAPATSQDLTNKGAVKNCLVVDAPVSGGMLKAAEGTLTFMVGGAKDSFDAAKPYLDCMGANIYHCGEKPGSGQVAKICNNLILGIAMNGVSEGLALGVKLGMDPKVLTDIVGVSSGGCWVISQYNPAPGVNPAVPASNGYKGGFAVDLMKKDLGLAHEAAATVDVPLQFGGMARDVYTELSETGFGDKDFGIAYQRTKGGLHDPNYNA